MIFFNLGDAPSDIVGKNLDSLKSLMLKWIDAEIQEFDIWNIEFETHDVRNYN